MFDHLFENRNTTVTHLLKLGDCLGRSLRENVELFSIDSETNKVAYLSESGKVLTGQYSLDEDITLNNIKIQEADIFSDNDVFNKHVEDKVSHFVGRLNEDKYGDANDSFTHILSLWENRLKFENVKKHLEEKSNTFSESQNIIETVQFQRFLEIMPQITSFLKEERHRIEQVQEIENAIKLSNSVSKAFNFPRLSYGDLEESKSYTISRGFNKSIYEMICKQELVKKELLESKKNFEDVWATNPHMRKIASLIFEDSEEAILESLVEAVIDIPFLALATKKQLFESINNAFSLTENSSITTKELRTYVSVLFEMKKPLKQFILDLLNEKYGISVQNLKETATFNSLASTQVVIFEALSRLSPKGSVVRETLSGLSQLLKNKNGVEVIDVNDVLQECFEICEYNSFCEDFTLIENISFETILDEETSVKELIEKARKSQKKLLIDKDKNKLPDEDNLSPDQLKGKKDAEDHEAHPSSDADLEDDSLKASDKKLSPDQEKEMDVDDDGDIDAKDLKKKRAEKKKVKEEVEDAAAEAAPPDLDNPGEESTETDAAPQSLTKDEFLDALKDMEELLKDMSPDEEEEEVDSAETDEREA